MESSGIINILNSSMESVGTGFFVSPNGNILTCKHVLEKAGYSKHGQLINYKYIDESTVYKAKWIKSANEEDLALLKANNKAKNYIPMCDKRIEGLSVVSYGFPNGSQSAIKASVNIERIFDDGKCIQLGNANAVTSGFSGAPLIHENIAVGIIDSIAKKDSNGRLAEIAFAISAKRIFEFFSKYVIQKVVCMGYGSKEEKCTNFVVSEGEGLCKECYAEQFSDAVKTIYQAQNYELFEYNDFFVAGLKYGISTYYDAIFTVVKFGEQIVPEDMYSIKMRAEKSEYEISQIIVVTNAKLSDDSLAFVKQNRIITKKKEELLQSLFDVEPYRKDLLKYVESEQLAEHYIEVYGTKRLGENEENNVDDYNISEYDLDYGYYDDEEMDIYTDVQNIKEGDASTDTGKKVLMKEYVDDFLKSEHSALLILGDYGSGKTSFCYTYTLKLLDKFIQGKSRFLPVFIKLRGYNKAVGIKQVLTDYFVNVLGINNFNMVLLKLLIKNMNVVFIFDGFDEIAKKVDFDIKYEVLKEICNLAEKETKIIVTCRPNFFQNESEFKQIFQNSHFQFEPGDKPLPEFIENSIAELDLSQIKDYIKSYQNELKKFDISITEVLQTIANTHDLADLAKRPFLLYMILNTLPELLKEGSGEKKLKINAYRLYVVYTDNWIKREDSKNKTLIKKRDKELFCKELAFELYVSNNISLSYKDFPVAIKKYFKYVERIEDVDYFTHDIQSCSFLTSDRSGDFKFIHKSFMEFFVADRVIRKLSELFEKSKKRETRIKYINDYLGKTYLSMEICLFINDMINYEGNNTIKNVSKYFDNVNLIAKSNLISILGKTGINIAEFLVNHKISGDLSHVDFSNTIFKDNTLHGVSFENIQFYSVKFANVTFINCNFKGIIFDKSSLENVKFYNCQFCGSEWRETKLFDCLFDIDLYEFYKEKYKYFNILDGGLDTESEEGLVFCDITDALWRETEIINCQFYYCDFTDNKMKRVKINSSKFTNVDFSGIHIWGILEFKGNILTEVVGEPYEFYYMTNF